MYDWAIISGIEGNLEAYEAVIKDIKKQTVSVETLYILGDIVGLSSDSEKVIQRLKNPRSGEPELQICTGWWEEQCFILHAVSSNSAMATDLIEEYGEDAVSTLWNCVSRDSVKWLRSLDFGFLELDCLLMHGSPVSYDDRITPETSPLQILDRLLRIGANILFCGRSGFAFQYQLDSASIHTKVTTLDAQFPPTEQHTKPCQAIGVGNVGRIPGQATYTLYNPGSNRVKFRTVSYGNAP
jgi:hypothetical protein